MSRLAEQRKNRELTFANVSKDLDSGSQQNDDRFWKVTRDKSGTGSAVIRFLPPTNGDELPWVKLYQYSFQGPSGKWFINNCPSTIGKPSPVMESNRELWESGNEADKEIARKRKRKIAYISNILVIKDPANPENEGKVKLFKYGKSIHDMISTKAKPEFDDDESVLVWDLWDGADFKLRIKTKDKYPTYESSEFSSKSELFSGDEAQLEAVLDKCHRLGEFLDPSQFKDYNKLKEEFTRAISGTSIPSAAEQTETESSDSRELLERATKVVTKELTEQKVQKVEKVEKVAPKVVEEESDDSDLDYFKKLLADT